MGSVAVSGIALLAVWFGNGLWHGAGGQYVLFGLYDGSPSYGSAGLPKCSRPRMVPASGYRPRWRGVARALQHVRTLGIVVVGEIIFRAPGGRAALQLLAEAVRNPSISSLFDGTVAKLGLSSAEDAVCLLIALAALLVVGLMRERGAWSAERLWRISSCAVPYVLRALLHRHHLRRVRHGLCPRRSHVHLVFPKCSSRIIHGMTGGAAHSPW